MRPDKANHQDNSSSYQYLHDIYRSCLKPYNCVTLNIHTLIKIFI